MNERLLNVAVVIAAYNEAANVGPLADRLIRVLDSAPGTGSWSLIFVVDGDDGTAEIVKALGQRRKEIFLDYSKTARGLGVAFRRGFELVPVHTDYVVTMDADLNHQPEEIPRLLQAAVEKAADIVVGSRRNSGSAVEGTPLWKTIVSRVINRVMQVLTGAGVKDMTSGFRIYRSDLARRLVFRNNGFAFLPEILINCAKQGARIVEEPIHFIFRKHGESKLAIPATSLSYVRLFARASFGVLLPLGLLLAIGVALRIMYCFPEHRYMGDSDSILAGLCALDVRDGKLPLFFPGGTRLGAVSCYVTAGMFSAFGPTRLALGATSVALGTVFVIFMYLALSQAGGRLGALVALPLVIMPPVEFWLATYPTWGYVEIVAAMALTTWLGLRLLVRNEETRFGFLFYGLSVALAIWCSLQSVMISGPMTAILIARRKIGWRALALVGTGILPAAVPYAILLARSGSAGLSFSYATRPVGSFEQFVSNIGYFATCTVPWLLFSAKDGITFALSKGTVQLVVLAAAVIAALVLCIRQRVDQRNVSIIAWFVLLVWATSACLFSVSSAGSFRGWTVRYALPVYLAIPFVFVLLYLRASSLGGRLMVSAAALALSILNCPDYPIFNGGRAREKEQLARQLELRDLLIKKKCDVVMGDYYSVYALNFDSGRSIRAIPVSDDYCRFEDMVRNRHVRLALVEHDLRRLSNWMAQAGLTGNTYKVADDLIVSVIDGSVEAQYLTGVRQSFGLREMAHDNGVSSAPPDAVADRHRVVWKSCYIDSINGQPPMPSTNVSMRLGLQIVGWAADVDSGSTPEKVFIELRPSRDKPLFVAAQRTERPDVAAGFSQPTLAKAGINVWVRRNGLPPGTYRIRVLQIQDNTVAECDTNRYVQIGQ